jgi:FlaA1/EpsC-like NDP-sugar epimerase
MGSLLGGLKAGVVSGIIYVSSLALVNLAALYLYKNEAISLIEKNFASQCMSITAEGCFLSVIQVYLPVNMFVNYMLLLFYSSIYGRLYEYIPGREYYSKGVTISLILLLNLAFFGSVITQFTFYGRLIVLFAAILLTIILGFLLGKFYRRYTRLVEFQSSDPEHIRVFVDGRDVTGKKLTLSVRSTHRARAEGKIPFKSWVVTGGVSVDDPRSYETFFEVNGDGILRVNGKNEP